MESREGSVDEEGRTVLCWNPCNDLIGEGESLSSENTNESEGTLSTGD